MSVGPDRTHTSSQQTSSAPSPHPFDFGFVSLIGLGVLVRLCAFVLRGALWNDEAGLALNVVRRAWSQVGRPFVFQQYAPYLYVLATKASTVLLGSNERALRVLPLLAGVALLPVMLLFVRRIAGWPAALFTLALLVPNPTLVQYTCQLGPAASDALITTGLALLTARVLDAGDPDQRRKRLSALALLGSFAPLCSLPSVFVLSACVAALCVDAWERELGWRSQLTAAGIAMLWLSSFALHYVSFGQRMVTDVDLLPRYRPLADGFAPLPPRSLADVRWYVAKFLDLQSASVTPGHFGLRYVAAGLWCWGSAALYRTRRALFVLLCTPLLLVFLASAAHNYLMTEGSLLFAAPLLIAPVVIGLTELAELHVRGRRLQLLAAGIAVAFCAEPSLSLARSLAAGPAGPGIDAVVIHLKQHYRPGDKLYVELQTQWAFTYYARRHGFNPPLAIPDDGLYDAEPRYTTLDALRGAPRAWVVEPALSKTRWRSDRATEWIAKVDAEIGARLARYGRVVDALAADDARLYLYDLTTR
jgi:hypothetical protein